MGQENSDKGPRLFRYEYMWERDPSLADEIKNAWNNSDAQDSGLEGMSKKLKEGAAGVIWLE
jgi:hypothetical protein